MKQTTATSNMIAQKQETKLPVTTSSVVEATLTKLIGQNPVGELDIDAIAKENPTISRSDLLDVLRQSNLGKLVVGRKGRKSRFVWGQVTKAKKSIRRRAKRVRNKVVAIPTNSTNQLCLKVGNVKLFFPISLELAA